MKRYQFTLIIEEGCDEFWESIKNKTGCDEVTEAIKVCLCNEGWCEDYGTILTLDKYTNFEKG